jgi:penicillin-insensitive murein endopeptidase
MRVEESAYVRIVPADAAGDIRWGLEPLVTMVERAARAVHRQFPEAVTSVGHLSREGGGEVDRHRSHESGRDADLGFFVRTSNGRPLLPTHFVAFRGDGTAPTWPGAYFDDAKNWALVGAILGDDQAHVTHVFVASPLRARLLSYAEKVGAPMSLRLRAAEVMQQPRGALPHDDHFHVRIACPGHMSGCVENPVVRGSGPPGRRSAAHGRRGPAPDGLAAAPARVAPTPSIHTETAPSSPVDAPLPTTRDVAALPPLPAASMATPVEDLDE